MGSTVLIFPWFSFLFNCTELFHQCKYCLLLGIRNLRPAIWNNHRSANSLMEFLVVCIGLNKQAVLFDLKILSVLSKALVLVWNYTSLNTNPFRGPEAILNAVSQTCPFFETTFCEISFIILGVFLLGRLSTNNRSPSAWF